MNTHFMLVYTSKSNYPFEDDFLTKILATSRERNLRDQITGFLVARDGYFLQLLEGPETRVRECYDRIKADERHMLVTLQGVAYSETRMMPEWSMGLVEDGASVESSEGLLNLFELGRAGETYSDIESLKTLLWIFTRSAKIKTL